MVYSQLYGTLADLFEPLNLRILLLLYDKPFTKMELYEELSNYNNVLVKDAAIFLDQKEFITGGHGRNEPLRLTVKGVMLCDWLAEGATLS